MKKFRKKPVVIEAYQFTTKIIEDHVFDDIPLPHRIRLANAQYHKDDRKLHSFRVRINTLEGETYLVQEGDWIIKGIKGEFYPCKPDIFEATYELVAEEQPELGPCGRHPWAGSEFGLLLSHQ